ncbi:transmembrane protein 272 isoform X5 [Crotalus tigris]|uniref:transmembrane protein 272 isoform X5 n=1 Tax=Crotalus tigris TaxID=88082 RepID=UPI00192F161B|nr:transmembrane protein 272 isoform X5 [Crotalus tigris]
MSWQQSLCREVGDVVARLLGGAVLLCVVSNAVFLFYLPSRRSRGSDGRSQARRSESRQPASSREGGPAAQRASPAEQRSEPPPTDRRRPMAGQRSRSGPSGWLGTADARAEQRRPLVFFVPEQLPSRASQAAGGLCKGPPAPDKPAQAVADGRRWHEAGLRESGSLPRQRALIAGPPGGQ